VLLYSSSILLYLIPFRVITSFLGRLSMITPLEFSKYILLPSESYSDFLQYASEFSNIFLCLRNRIRISSNIHHEFSKYSSLPLPCLSFILKGKSVTLSCCAIVFILFLVIRFKIFVQFFVCMTNWIPISIPRF
jgi:hypothetical protein